MRMILHRLVKASSTARYSAKIIIESDGRNCAVEDPRDEEALVHRKSLLSEQHLVEMLEGPAATLGAE